MKAAVTSTANRNGFTLMELSVALVIIGLIVGGVLLGKDLIRAAELRSIASDKERLVAAIYSFQEKYNALPGDMIDAQTIWGAGASCSAVQTTEATCNGDGDGVIEMRTPSGTTGNEVFLFWKHLANAGLIAGNYWGVKDGAASQRASTRNNTPSGKIAGSLWYVENWGIMSGSFWAWDGKYNNSFEFGLPVTGYSPYNPLLTSIETFGLDTKTDDGKPGSGVLVSVHHGDNCTAKADGVTASTFSDSTTAIYRTTSSGNVCSLMFRNLF